MKKTAYISSAVTLALLIAAAPVQAEDMSAAVRAGVKAELGAKATGTKKAEVKAEVAAKVSAKGKERANQELDRRTKSLEAAKLRVSAMKRLNTEQKASITAMLDAQIAELAKLKAEIEAQTDNAALKEQIKSITSSYRIFALIMPQVQIIAAADRMINAAEVLASLGVKLQARIDAARTAGKDVAVMTTSLANLNAKVADAKAQADAAVSGTASLTPDEGDKAKMEANKKALMEARTKLKAGHDALEAARKEAHAIVKALKEVKIDAKSETSATASTTVTQ